MDIAIIIASLIFITFGILTYVFLFRPISKYGARRRLLCDLLILSDVLRELYSNAPSNNDSIETLLKELSPIPLIYINGIYFKLNMIREIPTGPADKFVRALHHAVNISELIARNYNHETWFRRTPYTNPSRVSMLTVGRLVHDDEGQRAIERELKLFKN